MVAGIAQKEISIYVKFKSNVKQLANIMKMPLTSFRRIHDVSGRLNKQMAKNQTTMGKFGFWLRRTTHGMRGFKMEMLGVMFFGMAMQRTFMGLLQPALQLTGFFELLNTILGVVFLPIALALLDPLILLGSWLMNLSDNTKLFLGWIVLGGAILGTFLFVIGTLALGIGSIIIAFGSLLGIVEKLFPEPIGDFAAAFIGLNAAMLGFDFIVPIWEAIKSIVGGLWDKIKEMPIIQNLLEKFGLSVTDLEHPWQTLKTKVGEFFDYLFEQQPGLKTAWEELKENAQGINTNFGELATTVQEEIIPNLEEFMNTVKDSLIPTLKNLFEIIDKIAGSAFFSLLNKASGFALKVTDGFASSLNEDLARTRNNTTFNDEMSALLSWLRGNNNTGGYSGSWEPGMSKNYIYSDTDPYLRIGG